MTEILQASDRSLLVVFGNTLAAEHHARVMDLLLRLRQKTYPGVTSISPAYASVLVRFDPLRITAHRLELRLRELIREGEHQDQAANRIATVVRLPVCYEAPYAPDLAGLATESGLTEAAVVELHAAPTYRVYFLGFAPGFGYLGEVDPRIALPRFASPRPRVAAGSVGIAGRQTGIYPLSMPGGWRIVGRCPVPMLQAGIEEGLRTTLEPGFEVQFFPISARDFENWVQT